MLTELSAVSHKQLGLKNRKSLEPQQHKLARLGLDAVATSETRPGPCILKVPDVRSNGFCFTGISTSSTT